MGISIELARVAGAYRCNKWARFGQTPTSHMSFFSTSYELRQGWNNPGYSENPRYKANIKRRLNAIGLMNGLELTIDSTMKKLKRFKNKENAMSKLPEKTIELLKRYFQAALNSREIWRPARDYLAMIEEWNPKFANEQIRLHYR